MQSQCEIVRYVNRRTNREKRKQNVSSSAISSLVSAAQLHLEDKKKKKSLERETVVCVLTFWKVIKLI